MAVTGLGPVTFKINIRHTQPILSFLVGKQESAW
jgi:hypothetical protein